jgi:hypothetical protein
MHCEATAACSIAWTANSIVRVEANSVNHIPKQSSGEDQTGTCQRQGHANENARKVGKKSTPLMRMLQGCDMGYIVAMNTGEQL